MNVLDLLGTGLVDVFWSGLAALGFALLFNVPVRTVPGCVIAGAVGHGLRTVLMSLGMGIEGATLAAASAVGLLGEAFARRWATPATTFTIPGAIQMVPGTFAFRAMIGLLRLATGSPPNGAAVLLDAATNAVKTAIILGALAVGIAAPALLFLRRRPVI